MRSALSWTFFKPAKDILVPGMNFFGFSRYTSKTARVQTTPESALALEYENPSSVPDVRPTIPKRFGPTPCAPPCVAVWHCAARDLKSFAPFSASPSGSTGRAFGGMSSVKKKAEAKKENNNKILKRYFLEKTKNTHTYVCAADYQSDKTNSQYNNIIISIQIKTETIGLMRSINHESLKSGWYTIP